MLGYWLRSRRGCSGKRGSYDLVLLLLPGKVEEPSLPSSSTSYLTCLPSCIFISRLIQFLVYTMGQAPLDKYVRGWSKGRRHCTVCSISIIPKGQAWVCHPLLGGVKQRPVEGGAWAWWKTRLERQLGKFVGVRNTTETKNNPALGENSYDVHQEEILLIFWTIFLCTTFQKRLISREV